MSTPLSAVTILIGADICPIEGNRPYFVEGDAVHLFTDLLPDFGQADLVVANLECPLIERPSPIQKTGPVFGEPGECINGIREAGIDVLGLANNHIMDHGAPGLQNTLEVCERAGSATVGAGRNLAAARQLLIREVGGVRVALLAVAEHEFSIAGDNSWGANPLDVIEFVRTVQGQRESFDYLIVLFHGSAEFHVPTPRVRETCRFMVEMGASAVVVQHPHVLGGYEHYRGGHIVYGQGALVMDEAIYRDRKSFHEGYLVRLTIEKAEDGGRWTVDGSQRTQDGGPWSMVRGQPPRAWRSAMELIPFTQSDPVPGARRMTEEQEAEFRRRLESRSMALQEPGFVESEWIRYCEEKRHSYLRGVLGYNRILRKLDVRGLLRRFCYSDRVMLGVRNIVCCETHREAIETILDRRDARSQKSAPPQA